MKKKLKIAMFTPYEHTAPPPKNVIRAPQELWAKLADKLVEKGHKVTLFAPKGSETKAKSPKNNLDPLSKDKEYQKTLKEDVTMSNVKLQRTIYNEIAFAKFAEEFNNFDILHSVFIAELIPITALCVKTKALFTFHDPLNNYKKQSINHFQKNNINYNYISNSQMKISGEKNGNIVYNGIDCDKKNFSEKEKGYLFFAGRMRKIKGPDTAARLAKKLNLPLLMAGETYLDEKKYIEEEVLPNLTEKIKFIGMASREKMKKLYKNAKITLMPINAPEPFGLVMIESMACGTPVVAFDNGSPREIIKHGETGFVVKDEKKMEDAIKKIYSMPQDEYVKMRLACRRHVEENFSIEKMADEYEKLYYKILNK